MIRFDTFERLGVAVAAISDRAEGDCALNRGQGVASACEARRRFCSQCGVDFHGLVCAQQVHGARVACVSETHAGCGATAYHDGLPSTDALITGARGLPLAVQVADCVPVYLFDPEQGAGGLVHAGRRGTLENVSGLAVQALVTHFNSKPGDIHALIGPSAGVCCYEVSPQMASTFSEAGLPVEGRKLDLWRANAQQLEQAGVPSAHITIAGLCTVCDERFFSYRANDGACRNMALFVL